MKKAIFFLILSIVISAPILSPASEASSPDPRSMTFPELKFEIPKAERIVLDCGMPVYLLRNNELSVINITAMIHTGYIYDPPGKAGVAEVTATLMRSGGAGGSSPDQVDSSLEFMASSVESGMQSDMGTVTLSSLARNFQKTLEIFSDILLRPTFDPQRMELVRKRFVEKVRRENDDPQELADRELEKAIYARHPLGNAPTISSVSAISREDAISFHNRFYHPRNMILAVSGDFDRAEMIKRLNEVFGSSKENREGKPADIPQPVFREAPQIVFAKKETSQSVIRMGHLGITMRDPDLYAVRLLDYMLGGSFTSRLMMEIRTNQGLAYNVESHFSVGREFPGTFTASTETKSESTVRTISLMRKIIEDIRSSAVSDQELETAKNHIINSFIFGFTTPSSIAGQLARLEFYDYPADYLERYRDKISRVSKEDVLAAAKRVLKPESFIMVVVGRGEESFDKPLSTFGVVRKIAPGDPAQD